MKQHQYDYYRVDIPSDCEQDSELRSDMAINIAREQARLYVIPCEWAIVNDDGEVVIVRRKRRSDRT